MKSFTLAVVLPFLLFGCESGRSLAELCKQNQEICNEFGQDSWCKSERNGVARARIALKENIKDLQKYNLLVSYEGYIKCMSLASQIQHIKLKEKTTSRIHNLLKAQANLAELSDQTVTSNHPHLLYYHWSRDGNEKALEEFLKLEGTRALENTTAQYHLATYYTKRDIQKTLMFIYHALELHEQGTTLNPEIFQSLATIFTNKNMYKQAYIWLKIYNLVHVKKNEKDLIDKSLINYQSTYNLDGTFLDKVAYNTLEKIESGQFNSPKF